MEVEGKHMFAVQRRTARSWERKSGKRSPERAHASGMPMPAVQRKSCACGGGCPRCREKQPLQAKLELSQPGDVYEQEADQIAERVMRVAEPLVQGQAPTITPLVQRQAEDGAGMDAQPIVNDVLSSPGLPLEGATRTLMEPRFGHDFCCRNYRFGS